MGVVTAGVNGARFLICLGMCGTNDRVKLAENEYLGALPACVDYCVEAGDSVSVGKGIS